MDRFHKVLRMLLSLLQYHLGLGMNQRPIEYEMRLVNTYRMTLDSYAGFVLLGLAPRKTKQMQLAMTLLIYQYPLRRKVLGPLP